MRSRSDLPTRDEGHAEVRLVTELAAVLQKYEHEDDRIECTGLNPFVLARLLADVIEGLARSQMDQGAVEAGVKPRYYPDGGVL